MSWPNTIAELGEQRLLALLKSFCPADLVGDDAALVMPGPGQQLVVTTDVLVDGVHFSDRTTPPHAAGWRAAAANLSDLAAMGALGLGITVGLSLPPDCPVDWVLALYQGIVDCLAPHDIPILGGDVCRARQRAIAITALGQVTPGQAWLRSTAQVGDAIVVSGSHGGSRAGLELLLAAGRPARVGDPFAAASLSPEAQAALIRKHQYPRPRLDWPLFFRPGGDTAGRLFCDRITAMDSSDGLADAVLQICRASGLGARLNAAAIPLPQPLASSPDLGLDWALYGGEDFELVCCMELQLARQLCGGALPGASIIGEVTAQTAVELWRENGSRQQLSLEQAFQHFSPGSN